MAEITNQPPCTIVANVDMSGRCFIPDVFGPNLQRIVAALDWARVFNTTQQHRNTATELDAAYDAAIALAAQCKRMAMEARRMSEEPTS